MSQSYDFATTNRASAVCMYIVERFYGTGALCHPTKCHPTECHPAECPFYNIRPNVTQPNVTYAKCHLLEH
jgi:hypothetical protein